MSAYLAQAKLLLNSVELSDKSIQEARIALSDLEKTGGISLSDPRLTNAINLLTPFVVNYKVNQVLKLLKEVAEENQKKDLGFGIKKRI